MLGPVGVGNSFLATALGHIACRRRISVHFERNDRLHKRLKAARLDASYDQEMRKLIGVDLLLLDDFALQPLDMLENSGHLRALRRTTPLEIHGADVES
ncbi:MAG TPA: ATP-binding protein [Acidimicrobiales bacterium]